MKIIVTNKEYSIDEKITNILDALEYIKTHHNSSLGFSYGCKSGICGSCAIRVNGIEKLSCISNINNNDIIEPLKNIPILKDLIVDNSNIELKLKQSKAYLHNKSNEPISQNDVDSIDRASNCILCNSCYSSCPVFEINQNFLGPFALNKSYRYIKDKKESNSKEQFDAIQISGIWDCTLCGACSLVCPQNIDIKTNIMQLQNLSVQNGYSNPYFTNSGFDMVF